MVHPLIVHVHASSFERMLKSTQVAPAGTYELVGSAR